MDAIKQKQKSILYPLFQKQLSGNEKLIVDFGCGTGRFTPDPAQMTTGMEYIHFRSEQEYKDLFSFVDLNSINKYYDLGERFSIFLDVNPSLRI